MNTIRSYTRVAVTALLAACFAVAGCGTMRTGHVLTGQPGPPRGGVRIFLQGQPMPAGVEEVAIVQAVGSGVYARLENVVAGLQEEAGRLGCDAVLNVKIDQGSSTASGTGTCVREHSTGWAPRP
jgi:hypothetical protein